MFSKKRLLTNYLFLCYNHFANISSRKTKKGLKEWVRAQGADDSWVDDTEKFPKASVCREICSYEDGYIAHMDAELIGRAACELGAGRKTKDDIIDHSAGIVLCKKTGDIVRHGDILARFYTSDEVKIEKASELFARSIEFSKQKTITGDLILDIRAHDSHRNVGFRHSEPAVFDDRFVTV